MRAGAWGQTSCIRNHLSTDKHRREEEQDRDAGLESTVSRLKTNFPSPQGMDIWVTDNRIFSLFASSRSICHGKSSEIVTRMKSVVSTPRPTQE